MIRTIKPQETVLPIPEILPYTLTCSQQTLLFNQIFPNLFLILKSEQFLFNPAELILKVQ